MLLGENWCWSLLGPKGLRSWVLVRPRWSNPQPPSMHSSALPTELVPPRLPAKRTSAVQFWKRWLSGIETVSCKSDYFSGYMFKELSQFICIYFFSTDYHLRNGRASPWGLHRGMKAHGPERLSRLSVNKGSRLEAMVDRIHCFFF